MVDACKLPVDVAAVVFFVAHGRHIDKVFQRATVCCHEGHTMSHEDIESLRNSIREAELDLETFRKELNRTGHDLAVCQDKHHEARRRHDDLQGYLAATRKVLANAEAQGG
jgi:septal ring factor EnvC (AmiA/AmiB activator)